MAASVRKKHAIRSIAIDLIGKVSTIVLSLVTIPIFIEQTNDSIYGFWLTISSVLGFVGLLDFGLGLSLSRLVSKLDLRENTDKRNFHTLLNTAFFSLTFAGVVFFIVGLTLSPFIPYVLDIPKSVHKSAVTTFMFTILGGAFRIPLLTFAGILSGMQRQDIVNLVSNVVTIAGIGVTLLLLYAGFGLTSFGLAYMFTQSTIGLVTCVIALRIFKTIPISPVFFRRSYLPKLWVFAGYFQLARIANVISTSADALLINIFLGSSFVTSYLLTSKLATFFSIFIISTIAGNVFPAICQMFARKEIKSLQRTSIALTSIGTRLAVVGGFFLFISNKEFMTLWVGEGVYGGNSLNFVFVCWVLVGAIFRTTGSVIQASGDLKCWGFASTLEAVGNICISVILVKSLGLVGIAIGTVGCRTAYCIYNLYLVSKKVELLFRVLLWKAIVLPSLLSVAGCLLVYFGMPLLFVESSGWGWLISFGFMLLMLNLLVFEAVSWIVSRRLRETGIAESV